MLALPNVFFEKFLTDTKRIKMAKHLITSIHEKELEKIKDSEEEESKEIELS